MFSLANAQNKMTVGVGGYFALPMGTFGDVAGMGFGGGASFEYEVSPGLKATASAQYLMFGKKSIGLSEWSYSIIPIHAGAKYSFVGGLFGFVKTGLNLLSLNLKSSYGSVTVESSSSSTEFRYAAGVGYSLPMGDSNLDFSVNFKPMQAQPLQSILM